MAQYLPLPDGSVVTIREGETPEAAWARAQQQYPEAFGRQPVGEQPQGGFGAAFKAGVQNIIGQGALTAGKAGLLDPKRAEQIAQEREAKARSIFKPTEESFLDAPVQNTLELLGGSAPYALAPLAAGAGAAALGAPAAVGAGAAGLASLAQFTGSNLERQLDAQGKSLEQTSGTAAVGAAIPQAALDVIGFRFIPGIGKLFGAAGEKVTVDTARQLAAQTAKQIAADYAKATGRAMTAEGLTETMQQVLERAQAQLSVTDPEARQELLQSFFGGALLGGVLAPAGRAVERSQMKSQSQQMAAEQQRQQAARAAEAQAAQQQAAQEQEAAQQRATAEQPAQEPVAPQPGQVYAELEQLLGQGLAKKDGTIVTLQEQLQQAAAARDFSAIDRLTAEIQAAEQRAKELTAALPKGFVPEASADKEIDKLLTQLDTAANRGDTAAVARVSQKLQELQAPQRLQARVEQAQNNAFAAHELEQRDALLRQQRLGPDDTRMALFQEATAQNEALKREAQTEYDYERTKQQGQGAGTMTAQPRLFGEIDMQERVRSGGAGTARSEAQVLADLEVARASRDKTRVGDIVEELRALRADRSTRDAAAKAGPGVDVGGNRSLEQALGMQVPEKTAARQEFTDARHRAFGQMVSTLDRFNRGRADGAALKQAEQGVVDSLVREIEGINGQALSTAERQTVLAQARDLLADLKNRFGDTRSAVNVGTRKEPQWEPVPRPSGEFRTDLPAAGVGPTGMGLENKEMRDLGQRTFGKRYAAAQSILEGLDQIRNRRAAAQESAPGVDFTDALQPVEKRFDAALRAAESYADSARPKTRERTALDSTLEALRNNREALLKLGPLDLGGRVQVPGAAQPQPRKTAQAPAETAIDYMLRAARGQSVADLEQELRDTLSVVQAAQPETSGVIQRELFDDRATSFDTFKEFEDYLASTALQALKLRFGQVRQTAARTMRLAAPLQERVNQLEREMQAAVAMYAKDKAASEKEQAAVAAEKAQVVRTIAEIETDIEYALSDYTTALAQTQQNLQSALQAEADVASQIVANAKSLEDKIRAFERQNAATVLGASTYANTSHHDFVAASTGLEAAQEALLQYAGRMFPQTDSTPRFDLGEWRQLEANVAAAKTTVLERAQQVRDQFNKLMVANRADMPSRVFEEYLVQDAQLFEQRRAITRRLGGLTAAKNRAEQALAKAQAQVQKTPELGGLLEHAKNALSLTSLLGEKARDARAADLRELAKMAREADTQVRALKKLIPQPEKTPSRAAPVGAETKADREAADGRRRVENQKLLEALQYGEGDLLPQVSNRRVITFDKARELKESYEEAPRRIRELLAIIEDPEVKLEERVSAAVSLEPTALKKFASLQLGEYLSKQSLAAPQFKAVIDTTGQPMDGPVAAQRNAQARRELAARAEKFEQRYAGHLRNVAAAVEARAKVFADIIDRRIAFEDALAAGFNHKREIERFKNDPAKLAELAAPREAKARAAYEAKLRENMALLAKRDSALARLRGSKETIVPSRQQMRDAAEDAFKQSLRPLTDAELAAIEEKRKLRAAGKPTLLGIDRATEELAEAAITQTTGRTASPATRATSPSGTFRTGVPDTRAQRTVPQQTRITEAQYGRGRDVAITAAEQQEANEISLRAEVKASQAAADALQQQSPEKRAEEVRRAKAIAKELAKAAAAARKPEAQAALARAKQKTKTEAAVSDVYADDMFDEFDDAALDYGGFRDMDDALFSEQRGDFYRERTTTMLSDAAVGEARMGAADRLLDRLQAEGSTPFVRELAQRLRTVAGDVRTRVLPQVTDSTGTRVEGLYRPETNEVLLDEIGLSEEVALHELTHAATMRQLEPDAVLTPDQARAREELQALYDEIAADPAFAREYARKNTAEFISELMTDAELRNAIDARGNWLQRAYRALMQLLGLRQADSAQAVAAAYRLFAPAKPFQSKYAGVASVLRGRFLGTDAEFNADIPERVREVTQRTIGRDLTLVDKLQAHIAGFRTAYIDRFDGIDKALRQGVARGLIPELQAFQTQYFLRFGEHRNQFVEQAASNGVPQLIKHGDGTFTIETPEGEHANLSKIAKILHDANVGNEQATEQLFTQYLAVLRAEQEGIGYEKLNFSQPLTAADAAEIKRTVAADPARKRAFEAARAMYREYNHKLLDFMQQTDALSKDEVARLKAREYVPYYRNRGGVVELVVGSEQPVRIGNIVDQPYLKELVGDDAKILPFFTGALQNTSMLIDMALRNQQTKDVAMTLRKMDVATIGRGDGPTDTRDIVRFKVNGERMFARIENSVEEFGVNAELLVKGMEGIKTTLPTFLRALQIPANWLRKMVTRAPAYAVRQIIREPINAWLVSGANFTPVVSSVRELAKIMQGKSAAELALQRSGAISSNVITGDVQDQVRILRDISDGKTTFDKVMAAADKFAMQGDAATRAVLYDTYRKQGMTHMQALLGSLESMNFARRGVSPSMHMMSQLIPFFNAQVQGMDVIYRALSGNAPLEQQMNVRRQLFKRGMMVAAATVAYAAAMQDDEAYKNATPEQRALNWFLPLPGLDEPVRVPIPFELGYLFKVLPETIINVAAGDQKVGDAVKLYAGLLHQTVPFGIPQAVKPAIEVMTNHSFFTGEAVETGRERSLQTEERMRQNTTEVAKLLGQAGVLSPVQVDHLIRGYFGGLGVAMSSIPNFALRPLNTQDMPELPEKTLSQMPLLGPLFQPRDGRASINAAYDEIESWQQAHNTFQNLLATGRRADAAKFAQDYSRDIALNSVGGAFKQQMGELAKLRRAVTAGPGTPEEKRRQIDAIKQIEIRLSQRMVQLGQGA